MAALYRGALQPIPEVTLPCEDSGQARRGWFVYVIQLPRGVDRDAVVTALGARGVAAKPYFPAIHLMTYYRDTFNYRPGQFPVCEDVAARSIAIPFFPQMSEGQVARVAEELASRAPERTGHPRIVSIARRMSSSRRLMSSPRMAVPQDDVFRRLNDSLAFDWRLAPYDVEQSIAHASMLAASGIISTEDRDALHAALSHVAGEVRDNTFAFDEGDEDVHMAIERRVTELAGEAGGRLHTARSRNDQIATDMAMFTRDAALDAAGATLELVETLLEFAERHIDWPMPGYTHLQRAQPVYLGHHLLAYAWMLLRDRATLQGSARRDRRASARRGSARRREFRHRS